MILDTVACVLYVLAHVFLFACAFFVDAYCPDCRVRFEFQRVRLGKVPANNLRKARKAFGRRYEDD